MQALSDQFQIWFCDVWGVIHNGHLVFAAAVDALERHRGNGGTVVLVTNSPRTSEGVHQQLLDIGVPRGCWDAIVTSGDVTRDLIVKHGEGLVFHIGPQRDHSLFEGLDVQKVSIEDSRAIICTGLFDELTEAPEDYRDLLRMALARNLPFICANPDKLVRKGERLLACAGAIAEVYSRMGGPVLMAGKPFTPIYDLAMQRSGAVEKNQVLAIGDGPETDIKGAADYGLPVVVVAGGINDPNHDLGVILAQLAPSARVLKTLPELAWNTV